MQPMISCSAAGWDHPCLMVQVQPLWLWQPVMLACSALTTIIRRLAVQVKPEWPDKPGMVARRAHCDAMAAKQLEALPAGSR